MTSSVSACGDRIASLEVSPCVQRQEDPAWRFAKGGIPTLDGLIVTLVSESGYIGEGHVEAMAFYADDLVGSRAAVEVLRPIILGRDPLLVGDILADLDRALAGHEAVKAGLDCALHELAARILRAPLHVLFGGARRERLRLQRILPLKSPQEMGRDAARLAELGYPCLKVKIDGDADLAEARVRAVREAVGAAVRLSADANQSYTPKSALRMIERIAHHGVDLIEQPVSGPDIAGLKFVRERSALLIEADEAVRSLTDVVTLIGEGACDSFNLKVNVLGGLHKAFIAAHLCDAAGLAYRIGTAYGPRLIAAQSAHLAAALPSLHYPVEFAEFDHLLDDPYEGLEPLRGELVLPTGIGSGLALRAHGPAADAGRTAHD